MKIKICGICDPQLAYDTAQLGTDFIGMVFYEKSRRNIGVELAAEISKYTKQGGAQPVGVFVEQNAEEIKEICHTADLHIVQLHGVGAKNAHKFLPNDITKIYVINVNYDGRINEENLDGLDKDKDLLLYDGLDYGSGKSFCLDNFKPYPDFRFFLSGGLDSCNIKTAISEVHPYGVDTSSGVENKCGQKDIKLIKQFIETVRMAV